MMTRLANVSLILSDYDEVARWFTEAMGPEAVVLGLCGRT